MRVVFDTNILVSALVTPGGQGEAALLRVMSGQDQLVVSRAILLELLRVLSEKFGRNDDELARVALFLADVGELIEPAVSIHQLSDEPDNRILECAVSGKADVIVTGDKAILALVAFQGISMLRLSGYLAR